MKQSRNPDSGILISRNPPESSVSKDEREREGERGRERERKRLDNLNTAESSTAAKVNGNLAVGSSRTVVLITSIK